MHSLRKLNFTFLALVLVSPLVLRAQTASPKWTGVHVGVIGGIAGGNYNLHLTDGTDNLDLDSSFAGGKVGINGGVDFNVKGLVVGALADWSWSNAKFKLSESFVGLGGEELSSTIKQMTTIRGRVGHSHGRVLPYVHGGLLIADTEFKVSDLSTDELKQSSIHNGYIVGAGFEYFVAPHYTLTTEYGYNHVDGLAIPDEIGGGGSGTSVTGNPHFSTVTVGFNYHF